ncbi:MAG TPA: VOC family protein [Saprospiraceae bacterium]|nr:VOC family protein [Saprospiraceae bacterium]
MELPTNAANWFEIPATDFDRAQAFYNAIFDYEMPIMEMGPVRMGILPYKQGEGVGGGICCGEGYVPNPDGAKIYLNGGEDLSNVLARVEPAGGKVVMPKTEIGEGYGFMAFFVDSEGNTLGLHSNQ